MPVTMIENGKTVTIVRISGSEEVRQHLFEIGFVVGEPVTIVNNINGNLILKVKDARVALDRKLAQKVMVG
ncbi:MAG: ferrous iron transport protein A [Lachnospiraceae bacterium]|nr:ferrous iron transport protein A [Lachnospiraceae bacterium]